MKDAERSLLLIAHGSRREASNEEIRTLTRRLCARAGERFLSVRHAFLELAAPDILEGIEDCVADGAREVVVLPYFLAAGRHVVKDIPEAVAAKQAEHPGLRIVISPYLGSADSLAELLLEMVPR